MYQTNIGPEVLSGYYESYCSQGTREDADSTSKLTKYMASHKGAILSITGSLYIRSKLGVLLMANEGIIIKSSTHIEFAHAPSLGKQGLCGGSHLEDNFSLLQDKLPKSDLYDMLGWYLELKKYGNLASAGFEWDLKHSCN
jgi:hypothetical protein